VPAGRPEPARVAAALEPLLSDEARRDRIGSAALDHVAELARTEATAHGYAAAIDGTLALLRDPTRRALARWGGALVDLGVTEETLSRGYGLSYARALDDFATPASAG
jgi:hypothetical protein